MENRVLSSNSRHRILAAIMMTDAVGFSARMSMDEELTLSLIDRDLKLIGDLCEAFEGTLLKSTGDGLLVYFVSAVQAVSCGLEIQQRLADLMQNVPSNQYLMHRIGIHLGDIVVSESDVMGNGVNITARLQTYAKPGGLCISQTIYDLVKARLQLNATFLGPLRLKNIQETVPSFQVDLQPSHADETNTSLSEATQPVVVTPETLLQAAVAALTENVNHQRIRKLIFAACQHVWENDSAVLNQFELRTQLETLRQRYPNLTALKHCLDHIVSGLNRRTSYEAVAATILMQLEPWYRHTDSTQLSMDGATELHTNPHSAQTVAVAIDQHPDGQRLRKLLYCICHNIWENNPSLLNNLDLTNLVQQTRDVAPSPQDLRYHLGRIVKRLNRQAEYTRLANVIIEQFQPLYVSHGEEVTQLVSFPTAEAETGAEMTSIVEPLTEIANAVEPNPEATSLVEPCTEMHGMQLSSTASQEMTTLHGSLSGPIVAPTITPRLETHTVRDRANLMELRQDIMRYANPLRAKVLLYSCLHGPFGYGKQDWAALKGQSLDDLVKATFEYCTTFSDLESKLSILAHCLDNAEENEAVAGAISQAMKAYYPVAGSPKVTAHPVAQAEKTPQTASHPESIDNTQTALSPA